MNTKKKKKNEENKKVALLRIEPGPLTLMDIGRYALVRWLNKKSVTQRTKVPNFVSGSFRHGK